VPFFCHNNGINFLAKLFLSDEVKAEAVDVDLVRSCAADSHSMRACAVQYATFFSRSYDAVIRVYDESSNVIETHEHTGDFKEW
jgi:hypothetical protein